MHETKAFTTTAEGAAPAWHPVGLLLAATLVTLVALGLTAEWRWIGPPGERTIELSFPGPVVALAVSLGACWLALFARRRARGDGGAAPGSRAADTVGSVRDDSARYGNSRGTPRRVLLSRRGKTVRLLDPADIDWLEASGRYVTAHVGGVKHLVDESLSALAETLPPTEFVRVHRSAIVRLDRIVSITSLEGRDSELRLANGDRVRMSRTHRGRLAEALGTKV